MISGNMVGSYSQIGKTFILQDENGNEITGIVVDNPVLFTAGDNDVRDGMIYASDHGVSVGTKDIPIYRTEAGYWGIVPGQKFTIPMSNYDLYDYTKLQCIIAPYNTSFANSVVADKVVIDDCVYEARSSVKLSDVIKNQNTKSIDLNITNDSDVNYIIRFFMYREEV